MILFLLFSLSGFSQQWVNRYNGQGDYSDRFNSVLTDVSGNVFLAGSTVQSGNNQDILLLKLDANGNTVWRNIYNAPSSGVDTALAMAMDASGNTYITGYAKFPVSATDIITIKYNSAGVIQWTANYGYTTNQYEQGNSIVVDSSGNVFVTGQSDPDSTITASDDYVVIKYNSSGVQQWVQRTNGTGNGIDRPSKIVLDPIGNPVVTGRSDNLVNYDYLTVKYNASTGLPIWSVRYDRTHNDWATDLVINPTNGNIYVTGRSKNVDYDYATVCYNSSGVQQWDTIYDNGIGDNRATDIGIDSTGNLYVTGQSNVGTSTSVNYDITTLKYNSSGVQQWIKTYGGTAQNDDIPSAIFVSSVGNVFVTGSVDTDASAIVANDYVTLKYDTAGALLWSKLYANTSASNDVSKAIVVDSSGNIIVTGYTETIPQKNGVTIKYNASGVAQWTNIFNEAGDNTDKPNATAIDINGNLFVAGSVVEYGTDKNFALQKIDSSGNTSWVKTINGTSSGSYDSAQAVAVDISGSIYVAGYTHNKGTSNDFTVAKYDQAGTLLWINNYDYITENDRALAIAVDSNNNVYVTGKSDSDASNLISNDDILTIKYNTNGVFQWATRYNGTGNLIDTGRVIKVSSTGNVYVGGRTSNGTNYDYIVLKYNSSGVQQWTNTYNGGGNDEGFFMEIDAFENVYITGNSDNASATSTDIVTIKINSSGTQQWLKRFDGTAAGNDVADAIKIDTQGNVIVAGTTDTDNLGTTINNDICLIKYDNNGNQVWSKRYNGTANEDDQANDITLDSLNNIYLTGMISGTTKYDYATIMFTPSGAISNVQSYNGTNNTDDIPQSIIFKNNFLYVTGSSFGINSQADFTTTKYDTAAFSVVSTINTSQTFCVGATVVNLKATGINLHVYSIVTGGSTLVSTTVLTTGIYYVSQTIGGVESTRTMVNVTIDNSCTAIPDSNFEKALIDLGYDNVIDGKVLNSNISSVVNLDVSSKNISDMTGIQAFTSLQSLQCSSNYFLNNLDVTGLTSLLSLKCFETSLTSLNVSKLNSLQVLDCSLNPNLECIQVNNVAIAIANVNWKKDTTVWYSTDCSGAEIHFCYGATVLSLPSTGTGIKWYLASTLGTVLSTTTLLTTRIYYYTQTIGSVVSARMPVSVVVTPKAKAVTPTAKTNAVITTTVCFGGNIIFTSVGHIGNGIKWQLSTTSATTGFVDVLGATSATFTINNITYNPKSKFYVRTIVSSSDGTNGICSTATSVVKTITVDALTVAGNVTGGGPVCSGAAGKVAISGNIGKIQWQFSENNGTTWANVPYSTLLGYQNPNGATKFTTTSANGIGTSYIVNAITGNVQFRAMIKNGQCNIEYTTPVEYVVGATAVTGSINSSVLGSLCNGTGTTLTLSGHVGNTFQWQKKTATTAWADIVGATKSTYLASALIVSTDYRVKVSIANGTAVCSDAGYSNPISVIVGVKALAKTITSSRPTVGTATIPMCTSTTTNVLTMGANYIADTLQWQTVVSATTPTLTSAWQPCTGTNNLASYTISAPADGINWFRIKLRVGSCVPIYSSSFTVVYANSVCTAKTIASPVKVTLPFSVIAYPNPYNGSFSLNLKTTSKARVGLVVYDMTGRLIEQREIRLSDVKELQMGDNYPTGIYNIVVNQGTEMRTLRVIKK